MYLENKGERKSEWVRCAFFGKLWGRCHYPARIECGYILEGEWQVQFAHTESEIPVKHLGGYTHYTGGYVNLVLWRTVKASYRFHSYQHREVSKYLHLYPSRGYSEVKRGVRFVRIRTLFAFLIVVFVAQHQIHGNLSVYACLRNK